MHIIFTIVFNSIAHSLGGNRTRSGIKRARSVPIVNLFKLNVKFSNSDNFYSLDVSISISQTSLYNLVPHSYLCMYSLSTLMAIRLILFRCLVLDMSSSDALECLPWECSPFDMSDDQLPSEFYEPLLVGGDGDLLDVLPAAPPLVELGDVLTGAVPWLGFCPDPNEPIKRGGGPIWPDIPGINGGGWFPDKPNAKAAAAAGNKAGLAANLNFSISASFKRFSFARLFWNQIFTWVSVRLRDDENSARSAIDKYCFALNFLSSDRSCWVVNGVRGFRLFLCLRRAHFIACGGIFGISPFSVKVNRK